MDSALEKRLCKLSREYEKGNLFPKYIDELDSVEKEIRKLTNGNSRSKTDDVADGQRVLRHMKVYPYNIDDFGKKNKVYPISIFDSSEDNDLTLQITQDTADYVVFLHRKVDVLTTTMDQISKDVAIITDKMQVITDALSVLIDNPKK